MTAGVAGGDRPLALDSDERVERYSRHILLPEIGGAGQEKLFASRVLVVGAGGLGAPVIQYLAAAGVGTLGIADGDTVDRSNLQRQVIHATGDIGRSKVESAEDTVRALNPDIRVEAHGFAIDAESAPGLVERYDLVIDGTDNFATRFLLNDACHFAGRTLVSAALLRFDGQLSTFKTHARVGGGAGSHPCYRCIFPEPPPPGLVPSCSEAGVLGAVAGVLGTLQATEAVKELLGLGESLSGRLLLYDGLQASFRTVRVPADPACPLCGENPSIRDLGVHAKAA